MAKIIKEGTRVRFHDFADGNVGVDESRYIEGIVETTGRFADFNNDCLRYKLKAEKRVFANEEKPLSGDDYYYPPMNGVKTSLGDVCNNVKIVDGELIIAEAV